MPHDEDGQAICTGFLQSQFPLTAHSASIAILVFKRHVFFIQNCHLLYLVLKQMHITAF